MCVQVRKLRTLTVLSVLYTEPRLSLSMYTSTCWLVIPAWPIITEVEPLQYPMYNSAVLLLTVHVPNV